MDEPDPDLIKHFQDERRAFHVAVQEVVREFEDEGLVTACVLTIEISRSDGASYLAHRTFDVNGEGLPTWRSEGLLQDHLRVVDGQARQNEVDPRFRKDDED